MDVRRMLEETDPQKRQICRRDRSAEETDLQKRRMSEETDGRKEANVPTNAAAGRSQNRCPEQQAEYVG